MAFSTKSMISQDPKTKPKPIIENFNIFFAVPASPGVPIEIAISMPPITINNPVKGRAICHTKKLKAFWNNANISLSSHLLNCPGPSPSFEHVPVAGGSHGFVGEPFPHCIQPVSVAGGGGVG